MVLVLYFCVRTVEPRNLYHLRTSHSGQNCEFVLNDIKSCVQSNAVQEFPGLGNADPIPEVVPLSRWLVSGML